MRFLATLVTLVFASDASAQTFRPDRAAFFKSCAQITDYEKRDGVLIDLGKRKLKDQHIRTINFLFDHWERVGNEDKRQLAYIIATAYRETHGRLAPIREAPRCGLDEECREAAIARVLAKYARARGRPPKPNYALPHSNGRRYYGRGYSQLTLPENYRKADKLLGTGSLLYDKPDEALNPEYSRRFLIEGLLKGLYTRWKLSDFFSANKADWINARKVLNPGSPNKEVTAAYAQDLNRCLAEGP
ncbi:hypothetical protein [Bradyrhizobium sp. AUGA SZCCT0182]|uniref:hypothetical protein n=1 Tax=Bradyrhizobium sp. AUGA SZCCT0182 TaxID=2807667 RepID=UPI001BABED40|nr:hypothetical protein [Bradyrhizobium sp. AUGA SZCCT0182]MBR1236876.1 hypothetical protein [Bradyrhizobium sp. AUGA SZCCT0182]